MKIKKDYLPRDFTYAQAIATLLIDDNITSPTQNKIAEEKLAALKKSFSLLESYAQEGFMPVILDCIMEKKAKMILAATKIKDIREIAETPKIHFDGNKIVASPNSVPEEEMICWSLASTTGPLNEYAFKRYMELFEDFFGCSIDELTANTK